MDFPTLLACSAGSCLSLFFLPMALVAVKAPSKVTVERWRFACWGFTFVSVAIGVFLGMVLAARGEWTLQWNGLHYAAFPIVCWVAAALCAMNATFLGDGIRRR